jgi:hypothetical protein
MILVDKIEEPAQELGALLLGQPVDVPDVAANGEDALPPSDRVGADDGMGRLELGTHVLRGASGLVVQLEPGLLGHPLEAWLLKGGCEGLEELLVRLADAVVDLVSRSPESICGERLC